MKTSTRIGIIALAITKLLILLYINMTSQMQFVAQMVLIPLLLLETLGVCGYLLEFPSNRLKQQEIKSIRRPRGRSVTYRIKPAA